MISHRLANVVNSDKIYVMQKGEIVQHGTHLQLTDTDGLYKQMWQQQWSLENF